MYLFNGTCILQIKTEIHRINAKSVYVATIKIIDCVNRSHKNILYVA